MKSKQIVPCRLSDEIEKPDLTFGLNATSSPSTAPIPNTTAWAASSHPLPVTMTAARTTADSAALKRWPLGSTFMS